ncbi:polysaccharide deacetylase family protein [Chitinophaga pendula]|uniref:polysaccharide deacetylase family protein n=1 Tax=Chitinophaga TaxID=79328 RepID=UPI000BAF9DF0|nr:MULTISPECIES: polysaccharide deacetylase family protein [Chitinophaga]ASZ11467.1 polysaccharide deacetylase [Chitinophaga sp. MD30]UCJ05522.1 polysaccharide deacetylase family protein [Chitinophaga pendula]
MLNYRRTNIITGILLGILLLVHMAWQPVPWWLWILPLLAWTGLTAWGACNINAGFYLPVICKSDIPDKRMALTFDDGPLPQHTPAILDILKATEVPATFFCIGERAAQHPDLLTRIQAEGHVLANHSYSHHFWFDLFGPAKMLAELRQTDQVLEKTTGLVPKLFRPPYGVTNPNLKKAILQGAYLPVGWSIRSLDTVATNEQELLQRILQKLHPGAILLLHDTCEITRKVLPELITRIRQQGYTIERIDKLLNIPAYA